jgi:hypothetical protein
LKVDTDIITSISACSLGRAVISVYVLIFKTDVIVYNCDIIMCLMSHRPIFLSIRVNYMILTMSFVFWKLSGGTEGTLKIGRKMFPPEGSHVCNLDIFSFGLYEGHCQYHIIDSDTEKYGSVWHQTHYDVTVINNNISFEDQDIRREHFSPDFEGPFRPSRQLSKSSAREKNQVQ